jgi:hypothetical protein
MMESIIEAIMYGLDRGIMYTMTRTGQAIPSDQEMATEAPKILRSIWECESDCVIADHKDFKTRDLAQIHLLLTACERLVKKYEKMSNSRPANS